MVVEKEQYLTLCRRIQKLIKDYIDKQMANKMQLLHEDINGMIDNFQLEMIR